MSKAGLLIRSPIINLQNQIDPQTSIELHTDEPNARIYFTIDGTQPNPFRAGNNSTYLYRGGFRLNPGKHVLKSVTVTNNGLRESNVTTKYIDVDENGVNIERPMSEFRKTPREEYQPPPPPPPRYEEDDYWNQKIKALSPGNGNWRKTLEHLFLNIYDFVRDQYELREVFGWKQFGRIQTARVIDKGECYQMITTFKKPFYDQTPYEEVPLSIPKPKRRRKKRILISSDDEKSNRIRRVESEHEEEKRKPRIYTDEIEQQGTLIPFPDFDVNKDCERLRKALEGSKIDENVLIEILGNRTATQRKEIRTTYDKKFDRNLEEDLKREISSKNFRKILIHLLHSHVEFDCNQLQRAIKGLNCDEEILVEILATRSNKRLEAINNFYLQSFDRSLEDDIKSDINGNLKKILLALVQGQRSESNEVREIDVEKDAKRLFEAEENKWGSDKSVFIQILSTRSNAQLKAIFEAYRKFSKNDIEADIKSETSGNLCKALLAIVRIMRNRPGYFADKLRKALESVNTNEPELNRVIICRCEVDMIQIKQQYQLLTERSLENHIHSDTTGEYREILLELLKDPNKRTRSRHHSSRDSSPRSERKRRDSDDLKPSKIYEEEIIQKGTMIPAKNFDANRDADALRKAMKGMGTDEQTLINILGNRDTNQRLEIKTAFKNKHNRDLTKDLKSETSGNFSKLLERLMMDPVELDCYELKHAVEGLGTDENALIEILASRSNKRIRAINKRYEEMYKKPLEKDVRSDTSGDFRHLLVALMQGHRPETNDVNIEQAKKDAKSLIDAGSEKFKTDKARFNVLYAERNDFQLKAIFNEFANLNGKPIEEVVKKETKGDHQAAILAIIKCIQSRPHFFAERLRNALKGLGTKESVLNRIIITRSEVDLVQIKEAYKNTFNRELERDVEADTSGDYQKLLLEILKDPSKRTF